MIDRVRCEWRLKLCLAAVLAVVYSTGYLLIERHLWRTPIRFPLSPVDRWIGFSPHWVWVYQSIYGIVILPYLATKRDEIRRYALGFALIMLMSFTCFMLFPVVCPRTQQPHASGMYGFLIRYDLPYNTFPSLHMAVATYSALVATHVTRGNIHRVLRVLLPAWILLIGCSALATKQHYSVDLLPGVLLGWIACRLTQAGAVSAQPTRRPLTAG